MFEDAATPMTESCKLTNIGEGKIMALGYAYFRDDPSLPLGNPETGGLVTQAHPYRQDSYIEWIRLYPWNTDGAEILNASRPDFESNIAAAYADTYHLLKTCGSDNHKAGRAEYLGCMSTDIPLNSKADYIRAVREGICDIDKIRNPLSENTGV
ncbi:MAG: hypothetical protein MJ059_02320 [Lachnospiraceae bacterium]|nr:hypothetical protein [Lachnospiraceae bacterium]